MKGFLVHLPFVVSGLDVTFVARFINVVRTALKVKKSTGFVISSHWIYVAGQWLSIMHLFEGDVLETFSVGINCWLDSWVDLITNIHLFGFYKRKYYPPWPGTNVHLKLVGSWWTSTLLTLVVTRAENQPKGTCLFFSFSFPSHITDMRTFGIIR